MSMTTCIVGIKPDDEKFAKMIALRDACDAASVRYPDALCEYFQPAHPSEADGSGVTTPIAVSWRDPTTAGVKVYRDESSDGFEVDLRKLDPDIKILRFYNSY